MDVTSQHLSNIHAHITSIDAVVRKFQALQRYGTQISLDMTLEIRSQVKGHSRYTDLKLFRGGVKLFESGDPFASYSRKTRGWLHQPCALPVPARVAHLGKGCQI